MKTVTIMMFVLFSVAAIGQQNGTTKSKSRHTRTTTVTAGNGVSSGRLNTTSGQAGATNTLGTPGNTITDRRMNGAEQNSVRSNSQNMNSATTPTGGNTNASGNNTFATGIHPAENAKQQFDSVTLNNPNSINNRPAPNATVAGGNDTTVNVNSLTQNGIPTTSGAVDKSGQAQFGQSNWGNSRSTVGESQWTVPPPIATSFNKDFPMISNATWARNNLDTSIYSARYQSGAAWVTTNYNAAGQRLDTRTEMPLAIIPSAVQNYLARQPAGFKAVGIYKVEMQGRQDMYEIQSSGGKTVYLNNEGNEVRR